MFSTTTITAEIDLDNYIRHYRDADKFIGYCKVCDRYNRCWACPPFDFNKEEYIALHKKAYIIGTKINLSEQVIRDNQGWDRCAKISYEIIEEVRRVLDNKLLMLEKQYPEGKAFFAGTCHICPKGECMRIKGEPCIAPESIRPSLEAFGFDVSKTSSELLNVEMLWGKKGLLPEYFILVSGFFTSKEISDFVF